MNEITPHLVEHAVHEYTTMWCVDQARTTHIGGVVDPRPAIRMAVSKTLVSLHPDFFCDYADIVSRNYMGSQTSIACMVVAWEHDAVDVVSAVCDHFDTMSRVVTTCDAVVKWAVATHASLVDITDGHMQNRVRQTLVSPAWVSAAESHIGKCMFSDAILSDDTADGISWRGAMAHEVMRHRDDFSHELETNITRWTRVHTRLAMQHAINEWTKKYVQNTNDVSQDMSMDASACRLWTRMWKHVRSQLDDGDASLADARSDAVREGFTPRDATRLIMLCVARRSAAAGDVSTPIQVLSHVLADVNKTIHRVIDECIQEMIPVRIVRIVAAMSASHIDNILMAHNSAFGTMNRKIEAVDDIARHNQCLLDNIACDFICTRPILATASQQLRLSPSRDEIDTDISDAISDAVDVLLKHRPPSSGACSTLSATWYGVLRTTRDIMRRLCVGKLREEFYRSIPQMEQYRNAFQQTASMYS
jgi:hypothetical protein